MNIDLEELFPDGISNETAYVIDCLLQKIAYQWDMTFYAQATAHRKKLESNLYDPERPWLKKDQEGSFEKSDSPS